MCKQTYGVAVATSYVKLGFPYSPFNEVSCKFWKLRHPPKDGEARGNCGGFTPNFVAGAEGVL